MSENKLSTDAYKGVRDFYPEDMAVERYIFGTWAKTAESFGFERYDASILEPSDLYKAKGAENEEMVNEQAYTFTDRGDREVTLRPEMTPTVARMVAGRRRELQFPLRWYSIPNLFRYERPQRGRLREHWQLNCDLFGSDSFIADVEMIALAAQVLRNFGATPDMFEIRLNNRAVFTEALQAIATENNQILSDDQVRSIFRLSDRITKMSTEEFQTKLEDIVDTSLAEAVFALLQTEGQFSELILKTDAENKLGAVYEGLLELGITNVKLDASLARGFDYYTGTIFEIFDTSNENNRALLGGGRYDNLTSMFGGEAISGIGFGMGDVTMRDFLETHSLLPDSVHTTGAEVVIIPMEPAQNLFAEKTAVKLRADGHSVSVDFGTKKIGDKISRAAANGAKFVTVIGENEMTSGQLTFKNLETGEETISL